MKKRDALRTPDDSKKTLATIERCVMRDAVSVHAGIQAAYNLGKMDGQLQMASIGIQSIEKLAEAA